MFIKMTYSRNDVVQVKRMNIQREATLGREGIVYTLTIGLNVVVLTLTSHVGARMKDRVSDSDARRVARNDDRRGWLCVAGRILRVRVLVVVATLSTMMT